MWRANESTARVQERRKSTRYAANGIVQVQDATGGALHDCRLTDVSDGGVRLYAERVVVPDDFVLWLSGEATQRRRCRVAWRLGHEVGAEFIDDSRQDFGRRVALAKFGARA